jgi:ATP-dependent DNA ligase
MFRAAGSLQARSDLTSHCDCINLVRVVRQHETEPQAHCPFMRKTSRAIYGSAQELTGDWQVTLKLDGVRAIWRDEVGWLSRANKPLYNIPPWRQGNARDCEIFVGSFRDTIRATRTKFPNSSTPPIQPNHLYGLEPLDTRLRCGTLNNPTAADIRAALQFATEFGFEGLVLRQNGNWIKVKPEETHDVVITGYGEGNGRHLGRLGFVTTARGTVGSGFSDAKREFLWAEARSERLIGQVIEVSCMEFTSNGLFRHPYFVRMRPDKLTGDDPLHPL